VNVRLWLMSCATLAVAGCVREAAQEPSDSGAGAAAAGASGRGAEVVEQERPPEGAVPGDALFQGLSAEAGFPDGLQVRIDGAAVESTWLEEKLGADWSAWRAEADDDDEALGGFFAEPRVRCGALLEAVLLDREARARFPELDADALAALDKRLRAASGGRMQWHLRVHDEDAARAYLEREHRRALLEDWFAALSEEVSEEEVFAVYEREVLANLPPPEQREGFDVSYETRGPQIRERLQRERGQAALRAWLDERLPGARLVVALPDGSKLTGE